MAAERPSLEELSQRNRLLTGLYVGTAWKHVASGKFYEVTKITMREADADPTVDYSPVGYPDLTFNRPLSEWLEMIGADQQQPRFARAERTVTYA
jgi:hypothetical protein